MVTLRNSISCVFIIAVSLLAISFLSFSLIDKTNGDIAEKIFRTTITTVYILIMAYILLRAVYGLMKLI